MVCCRLTLAERGMDRRERKKRGGEMRTWGGREEGRGGRKSVLSPVKKREKLAAMVLL